MTNYFGWKPFSEKELQGIIKARMNGDYAKQINPRRKWWQFWKRKPQLYIGTSHYTHGYMNSDGETVIETWTEDAKDL